MGKRKKGERVHGWIVLDKPKGMTSTQAVSAVRRIFNAQKAGHAGTLDPLATGVLAIALGEATKTVPYAVDALKTYRFTVRFGEATATDDTEGAVTARSDVLPTRAAILSALPDFIGDIMQTPPAFSAVKVDGERAYDLAREGEAVELSARPAFIGRISLVDMPNPAHAVFEMVTGKGVYVRAFARDLALKLGTYGHVTALRRTQAAGFDEADAILLDRLAGNGHIPGAFAHLLPVETALDDIPALAVTEQDAFRLRGGMAVMVRGGAFAAARQLMETEGEEPAVFIRTLRGEAVAIARLSAGMIHPARVFNFS
ncbi:MAG TPA: tRNA pseudouridine(55) synthase TruB [Micropepsaceae bacterium]|nr:tRNA pseudouridine(55) synthase TruB [Micropepsaceae bacterium]